MKKNNKMVKNQKPKNNTILPDHLLVKDFLDLRQDVITQMKALSDENLYYYSDKYEYLISCSYGSVDSELADVKRSQINKALLLVQRLLSDYGIILGSYIGVCQNLFDKEDYEIDDLNNLCIF